MFSNPNRSNRLHTNSIRSNTPQHNQVNKNNRMSQSQNKSAVNSNPVANNNSSVKTNLSPIVELNQIEKPYYLGKGNNHEVIKRILSRRKGWGEMGQNDFVLFRWVQSTQSLKFHTLGK